MQEEYSAVAVGRNAAAEMLKSDVTPDTLYILQGSESSALRKLVYEAKKKGAVIKRVNSAKLKALSGGVNHQGVVCVASAAQYATVDDIFESAQKKGTPPFIILADEIEDPHNLGAIIRTAEAAGADGVIIPKRRSVSLTAAVFKTSAGALSHMPVARVSNLAATADELKKRGVWLYAADMDGSDWCGTDYSGAVGLVIGSEGRGVSHLLKQKCDFVVSLKMCGMVNSLNASVAGGIIMYEICRQRNGITARNK